MSKSPEPKIIYDALSGMYEVCVGWECKKYDKGKDAYAAYHEAMRRHCNLSTLPSKSPKDKQVGGDHYKTLAIQPGDYIVKNGLGWYEGNAIKYVTRHRVKGQKQDIEKAIHYLELLLEEYG